MKIYGVYFDGADGEELQNLYLKGEDAQDYLDSRKVPEMYFIQEMQVY